MMPFATHCRHDSLDMTASTWPRKSDLLLLHIAKMHTMHCQQEWSTWAELRCGVMKTRTTFRMHTYIVHLVNYNTVYVSCQPIGGFANRLIIKMSILHTAHAWFTNARMRRHMMLRVSGSDSHVRDHFQQQVVAVEFIMIIKCACNHEDTAMQSRGPRCNHDKMACTSVSLLKSACSVRQLYATQKSFLHNVLCSAKLLHAINMACSSDQFCLEDNLLKGYQMDSM